MLLINHKAIFLYREDAYRDYCFSTDGWGFYQPASFIFLSFESFKDVCKEYDLRLMYLSQDDIKSLSWRYKNESCSIPKDENPNGLILRVETDENVATILNAINQGKNVIALIPSEFLALYYRNDISRVEKARECMEKLGVNTEKWKFDSLANCDPVDWIEVSTSAPGRLFVTRDCFLSDGYFMEGYGYTEENIARIRELVKEFSTFKYPLLSISFQNKIDSWPTQEPLTLVMDVWNHGPSLSQVTILMDIAPELEPLSPLERLIPSLQVFQRRSFAFQAIPHVDGEITFITDIQALLPNAQQCNVVWDLGKINIVPSFGSSQKSHVPEDDQYFSRLISVLRDDELVSEAKKLPSIMRADIDACLNRLRVLTEKILSRVLRNSRIGHQSRNLVDKIGALRTAKIISEKTVSYLNTIRVICNIASHESSEPISDIDVRIVSYALSRVAEELISKKLL